MSSRLKKILLYLLLAYALFGFLILPPIVKPQLIKIIEEETNSKIKIETLSFNPFIFKLELSDVRLSNLEDEELVSFKEFIIDLELYSVARKALHVKELTLVRPKVSLTYNADKTINILNILKDQEKKPEDNNSSLELPRIILDEITIKEGEVLFKDLTLKTPFAFSFHGIGFQLKDVDTDESTLSNTTLRFYATLGDGGFVNFKNNLESLSSFRANGSLDFEASRLYTEWKYVQDILNLEVADGKISFHGEYKFALDDINATTIENLSLDVEKLRIKPKSQQKDILTIEKFSIENATIMPMKQKINIEKIALDGLKGFVKRKEDGEIDWMEYIALNQETNASAVEAKEGSEKGEQAWSALIKELSLEKIALSFNDTAITPSVKSHVNELNFYAKDITLSGEKPFSYKMNMQLNEEANCTSEGNIRHKELDIKAFMECQDFDVTHYNPYIESEAKKALKRYRVKLKTLDANFNANLHLQESNASVGVLVSNANVALNNFQINREGSSQKLLSFKNFLINGISVDTNAKSVNLEKVTFNNLSAKLEKYKNGSLNVENLIEPKKSKSTPSKTEEEPYSVHLNHFALQGSRVEFKDNSLEKSVTNKIGNIYANAYDLDLKKNSWLRYDLSMRVNSKGSVKTKGKLRHTPLKQSGSFDIQKLSLVELTPYLQESAYVAVEDGKLSLKGTTKYAQSASSPDLRVEGSVALESLFVNDTLHQTLLLSLNDVKVNSYTLELNPNRVHIDEVNVGAFYVDAKIDENKTLNFSALMKKSDENSSLEVAQTAAKESTPTFPYRILKVNVALGSAKFADYSIPIKFATHIHDLNGAIYAISNSLGDTTYVDIDGEVDQYASTSLKGSIDSSNPKAYMDLDFDFKNLNLNSFSGYSASFAGHEIDSGKLYLDLGYKILDSQLLGSNSVVIKKIKLGREIDDENVTVLPLGFVIGLLEDSDGIVDIDMPVAGNLDEPDFKYGKLLFKTFGNLIAKAVTSPFKFLSSAMGMDGEALEYIAYEPGSSDISPPQREKLDKITQMMLKKPKIILSLAGKYELKKDKEALQSAQLIELVVEKSGVKNVKDHKSVMNIHALEEIYSDTHDDKVLSETQNRLRLEYKNDAAYERAYSNELILLCRDAQVIPKSELISLADMRADKIIAYLVEEKMLKRERIIQKPSQVREEEDLVEFVKVDMEIKVK